MRDFVLILNRGSVSIYSLDNVSRLAFLIPSTRVDARRDADVNYFGGFPLRVS